MKCFMKKEINLLAFLFFSAVFVMSGITGCGNTSGLLCSSSSVPAAILGEFFMTNFKQPSTVVVGEEVM